MEGGIWKTENYTSGAPVWMPLTDQLPSLFITAIVFSADGQTMYAGTEKTSSPTQIGEPISLLKSIDEGNNWTLVDNKRFADALKITNIAERVFVTTAPNEFEVPPNLSDFFPLGARL